MDDAHLWRALAYVERNPVRAGLTEHPGTYPWSSAEAHLTGLDKWNMLDLTAWRERYTPERWAEVLRSGVDEEALGERLHEATRLGRPLGAEGFALEMEARTGRALLPQRPGPKRDSILNSRSQPASAGGP
jgi:putative transposase